MDHQDHPERFHALDATRAFALLLGVLFHGVWFYTFGPLNTGVKDVGTNHAFSWFFGTSHTFRMQSFFLIAGFFARLVIQKRGTGNFVRNRFYRIVIPMIIGWLILFPLLVMVWFWGKNASGFQSVDVSPLLVGVGVLVSGAMFVERDSGGIFGMAHLWFLYYLVAFYALTLSGRFLLGASGINDKKIAQAGDRFVRFLALSPRGALVLTVLIAPLIWSMDTWSGIDTPGHEYLPDARVTAAYLVFYLLGWFIHRQVHELGSFFTQWRSYIGVGLVASIGLYIFHSQVKPYDSALPPHSITYRDVHDWPALQAILNKPAEMKDADSNFALNQLISTFTPHQRKVLKKETTTFDERYGILTSINGVLADPGFLTHHFRIEATVQDPRERDIEVIPTHRKALQPFLRGVAAGDYREESWYQGTKAAFSLLYSLVMVFLVYGCLGIFQELCTGFSPVWRYLADSSYWVYLIHIPVVPAIETLVFDHPLTPWIKFPLVLGTSLTILYASYHYLVRSTFLGKTLNGRAYPFHWNPLAAIRAIPEIPKTPSIDPSATPPTNKPDPS